MSLPRGSCIVSGLVLVLLNTSAVDSQPKYSITKPLPICHGIVCDGFHRSGKGLSGVFGKRSLLDGACSWYCNRNLVTLPYVGGTPIPHTEAEVSSNTQLLSDGETRMSALFSRPLATSLNWTLGLGPDPVFNGKYTRLTADELSEIGFGGLLVVNGNISSAAAYQRYARLKAARLFVDDTCVAVIHFVDTPKVQWIRLNRLFALDTLRRRHLKLQVTQVYPGRQDTRLAIAEMQLDGSGGHSISYRMCPGP